MKNILKKLIVSLTLLSTISTQVFAFTDTDGHWAQGYIEQMYNQGYINGYTDGSFLPNKSITRGEFSKIICTAFGLPELSYPDFLDYPDVSENAWYAQYIAAADVFLPKSDDNLFHANLSVSRLEAGYTLLNLYEISPFESDLAKTMSDYNEFKNDTNVTNIISALLENGIMKGKNGKFAPNDILTRAELCTLIMRTINEKGRKFSSEEYTDKILSFYLSSRPTKSEPEVDGTEFELEVLELINARRAENNLPALEWDSTLAVVAKAHSVDMVQRNFFDHNNPDGLSPFDRMKNYGITYSFAAENIAAGQKTPEAVMESWMNSQGHRENILNSEITKAGIGVCEGGNYGIYWTTCFTAD